MNSMKRYFPIILTLFMLFTTVETSAQMTRGQLLRKYYQITQLHNSGKDAEAIAICEEITAMYPKMPDTYLRMAVGSTSYVSDIIIRPWSSSLSLI